MRNRIVTAFLLLIGIIAAHTPLSAQVIILSGVNGGSYQEMANDISKLSDTIIVDVLTSNGSLDNFERLMANDTIDFTFLQEDVLFYQQLKDLEEGTNNIENIRIILPLGYEEIHLIARKDDASITKLADLAGKKVGVGAANSGTAITSDLIKDMTHLSWKSVYLGFDSIMTALVNNEIDAFFFVGAAPVSRLASLPPMTNIKLIPLNDYRLNEIYKKSTIPANTYKWQHDTIATFSGRFVLATNVLNIIPDREQQYRSIFYSMESKFDQLQTNGHPKWSEVDFDFESIDWQAYKPAEDIFSPKAVLPDNIIISSGVHAGSYNQFAQDMQKISDSITIIESQGSLQNLQRLIARDEAYISFVQYDVLVDQRMKDLKDGTDYSDRIRVLLPLANEEIHLVTKKGNDIFELKDLKKRRVAIGTLEQGTYVTASLIKELTGINWIDEPLSFDEAFTALTNDKIDAFFFVGASPVQRFSNVPDQANFMLVPVEHKKLDDVYEPTVITAGTYSWVTQDIPTYSVRSVLATNILGETPGQRASIRRLLNDINANTTWLLQNGHPKWADVDFSLNKLNWKRHDEAIDLFKTNR